MMINNPISTIGNAMADATIAKQLSEMSVNRTKVMDELNALSEGVKYDQGKPPIGLIPRSAIEAEAKVMAYGAKKYERHNWKKGMAWSRPLDAALRHILAFIDGENTDPETGLSHLAHARCCLAFVIDYEAKGYGDDDRG